jgi:hypothetical protein
MLYIITLVSADLEILLFSQVKASSDACCNVTISISGSIIMCYKLKYSHIIHEFIMINYFFILDLQYINNILNLHFHFQVSTQSSPPLN